MMAAPRPQGVVLAPSLPPDKIRARLARTEPVHVKPGRVQNFVLGRFSKSGEEPSLSAHSTMVRVHKREWVEGSEEMPRLTVQVYHTCRRLEACRNKAAIKDNQESQGTHSKVQEAGEKGSDVEEQEEGRPWYSQQLPIQRAAPQ